MRDKTLLIESQYLPPVSYFAVLYRFDKVLLEQWENFQKSSYRNRCYIAGPNGKLRLSIPLDKGKHQREFMKDVKIYNEEDWQKNHWQSLCSCYRRSPYFEYYEREFEEIYSRKHEYLFELNFELIKLLLRLMDIQVKVNFTNEYLKPLPEYPQGSAEYPQGFPEVFDMRSVILPNKKMTTGNFEPPEYHQVFQDRTGFYEDLSVVDLLFNEGPHARDMIKNSWNY